jgi:hypothetical protein
MILRRTVDVSYLPLLCVHVVFWYDGFLVKDG